MDPFEFHPYCRIPYPVSIYPSSLLTLLFPARNLSAPARPELLLLPLQGCVVPCR